MLRKMDRHILGIFVVPFLLLTAVALGLSLMLEIIRDLDAYVNAATSTWAGLRRLFWVYSLRAPSFLIPLVPMTILVAGAFALARLERDNELTALKASGVSIHRVLAPIFLAAAVLALGAAAIQEFVVPPVEQRLLSLTHEWKGRGERWGRVGGFYAPEQTQYMLDYNPVSESLRNVLLIFLGEEKQWVSAQRGDRTAWGWRLSRVRLQRKGEEVATRAEWEWRTRLRPRDLEIEMLEPSVRSLPMLADLMRRHQGNARYRILFYARLIYPLHGIILLLVAVPVILSHAAVRKSRLFGAGIAILLGGVYYVVTFLCHHLGGQGNLPPLLAAWLPVAMFASLGLYLFDNVPT